jgi:hypothetical protein
MKTFLSFALLALALPPTQTVPQVRSGLEIVGFEVKEKVIQRRGFSSRMVQNTPPKLNPTLGRGADINEPEIQKIQRDTAQRMRELRALDNKLSPGGGGSYAAVVYEFHAQMTNTNSKSISSFVWAYRPTLDSLASSDKEFLCDQRFRPGETKTIKSISSIPRVLVVSASDAGTEPKSQKPSMKAVVVNQVWFSDGTNWKRADWNPVTSIERTRKSGKGKCVAL